MNKKYWILSLLYLSLTLLIISCGSASTSQIIATTTTTSTTSTTVPALPEWWVDATFYEIFVRSFYDSDGDGIGDLNGITAKLDYLNDGDPATTTDLGVTGIWLMPINPSPSYHGYDVTDYYGINPEYGTIDDFKTLVSEAHKRGIHVIIDLVLNHCSNQHPWFIESASSTTSPKRDWFIWSATNPGYLGPWGEQVWWPLSGSYYYGIFSSTMPDLNYRNPEVVSTMEGVVRYWLEDFGIDGFRLDAAKHIIEEGEQQENTRATHNFWKNWRINFKDTAPDAIAIGEVWSDISIMATYVQGDELDGVFNFALAGAILDSANNGSATSFVYNLDQSVDQIPAGYFSPFITNHDQNRTMSQLGGSLPKAKAAASLLLISPGTPFIYYGEEIGMEGVKPDENIRRPMQWSSSANAGFTTGTPWRAPDDDYTAVNVAAQTSDTDSLLSHYRRLIALRNSHNALKAGSVNNFTTSDQSVYAGLRFTTSEAIVAIVNTSSSPITNCTFSLASGPLSKGNYSVSPLMGTGTFADLVVGDNGAIDNYLLTESIPAYGTIILGLEAK
jgi:alpha-amylase